jgi:hypothetical protein
MHASGSVVCATLLLLAGCSAPEPRLSDREAIADTLSRANRGFELSDPDLFAGAFGVAHSHLGRRSLRGYIEED